MHLKAGCWTGPLWRVSQKTGKVNEERWAEGAPFSTAEAKAAWEGGTLGTWQLSALIQPPPWPMENGMWMRTWGRCILPLGATVQMEVNMHMAIGCSGVHCASPRTTAFKAPAGCSKGTQTHAERWGPTNACHQEASWRSKYDPGLDDESDLTPGILPVHPWLGYAPLLGWVPPSQGPPGPGGVDRELAGWQLANIPAHAQPWDPRCHTSC